MKSDRYVASSVMTPPLDNAAMDAGHKNTDGCWRAGAVISVWLIAIFLLGRLSLLSGIVARCVFPYGNLVERESASQWRLLFTPLVGVLLDILQWGLLIAVFARSARNIRLSYLVPLGFCTVGFVAVATAIIASLFSVEIDAGFLSHVAPAR